jgi:peptidoglycan hydrolase-like protein with peptidoglycan-binding domain
MKNLILATVAAIPLVTGGALSTLAQQHALENQGGQQQSTTAQPTTSQRSNAALSLDQIEVRHMQEALNRAGFEAGRDDGIMGPRTQQALREFQEGNGLHPTGTADEQTLVALSIDSFNAQPATERPSRPTTVEPDKQSIQPPTAGSANSRQVPPSNK